MMQMNVNKVSEAVIGACIEVHRHLGPGLLESAYEECVAFELQQRGLLFERQVPLPVTYKSRRLDCGYRVDLVVAQLAIVELKSIAAWEPIHKAQILTYMRLGGWRLGLLVNFNVPLLRDGIKRCVLGLSDDPSASSAPLR